VVGALRVLLLKKRCQSFVRVLFIDGTNLLRITALLLTITLLLAITMLLSVALLLLVVATATASTATVVVLS
jgi:hypothetical protein